jgi:hypothetical protein
MIAVANSGPVSAVQWSPGTRANRAWGKAAASAPVAAELGDPVRGFRIRRPWLGSVSTGEGSEHAPVRAAADRAADRG